LVNNSLTPLGKVINKLPGVVLFVVLTDVVASYYFVKTVWLFIHIIATPSTTFTL
jgi:hypothetical protein